MQVHPGYPVVFAVDLTLAFRNFQLSKLKYEKLLSNIAFNCNLRHYTLGRHRTHGRAEQTLTSCHIIQHVYTIIF